jgi:aspergillopepsin I
VDSTLLPLAQQAGHTVFNTSASPNFQLLPGYTFNVGYADGNVTGLVGTSKVTIGGISIPNQAVEVAQTISDTLSTFNLSGRIGLAPQNALDCLTWSCQGVRPVRQPTFFDNIKSSLPSPVFTVDLKHQAPGTFDFGFINSSKYQGDICYETITPDHGFWEVAGNGFQIGAGPFVPGPNLNASIDTGVGLILVETAIVTAYYSQVHGAFNDADQGGYVFPCETKLPDLTLRLGEHDTVISGALLNYGPIASSSRHRNLSIFQVK